jgi:hypothetical protein
LRAVLREVPAASRAREIVEDAARGEAQHFEARALWPRILARLLAADLSSAAEADGPVPAVQIVDGEDAALSREVFREWSAAADALRSLAGELGPFLPRVLGPQHVAVLADAQPGLSSVVLVHTSPLRAETLREARLLAARRPIRAALFRDHLDRGRPYEEVRDLPPPLDPRYREEIWVAGGALPLSPWDLVSLSDQATAGGFLTTPVSHLLSATAVGMEECHAPPRPAPSPRAGRD